MVEAAAAVPEVSASFVTLSILKSCTSKPARIAVTNRSGAGFIKFDIRFCFGCV